MKVKAAKHAPKVAYLSTASGVGGAEKQVHDLAIALHTRGWQVRAISMLPLGEFFADLPEQGIPTFTLGMKRGRASVRALLELRRYLQQEQPQILHAHMVHANLLARIVHLLQPATCVITTMHNQYQGGRWRQLAYRLTDRLSDRTTTVSQVALDAAVRQRLAPRSRIEVVPNGLDTEAYSVDPDTRERTRRSLAPGDEFLWLAVGRLTDAKDYPNLIAAFEQLMAGGNEQARLVIAGEGPTETSLREIVARMRGPLRVDLLGQRHDIPALMQAADGFVMSSAWEGLPMVLLEAGASGLPAVVTDVGGSREAIVDAVSGHIVPPKDASALAAAMLKLMQTPAAARLAMGLAGREHVTDRFGMSAVADRWEAIYRELSG